MDPIEQIWKEIRKLGFKNEVFTSLDKVVDRLCLTICSLLPEIIPYITGRPWILVLLSVISIKSPPLLIRQSSLLLTYLRLGDFNFVIPSLSSCSIGMLHDGQDYFGIELAFSGKVSDFDGLGVGGGTILALHDLQQGGLLVFRQIGQLHGRAQGLAVCLFLSAQNYLPYPEVRA